MGSSTEVVRPQDLEAYKQPLVESVFNAYMTTQMPKDCHLKYDWGSCGQGEFRYYDNADGCKYYCYWPSGQWKEDIGWCHDPTRSPGDRSTPVDDTSATLIDVTGAYNAIKENVSEWVDPWINDCQSPNVFTNQINSIANVANHLYIGDQVIFGAKGSKADGNSPISGNTDLSSSVKEIGEVPLYGVPGGMQGNAMDTFSRVYGSDIATTIGGQRGLATAAGPAITAQATALHSAYKTMRDFMKKARHDFNNFADCAGDGGEDISAELGAVGAVAGLAGASVGVAFPPFGGQEARGRRRRRQPGSTRGGRVDEGISPQWLHRPRVRWRLPTLRRSSTR